MEEVIKKAIKGGWKPAEYRERSHFRTRGRHRWNKNTVSSSITTHEILLDPLFWQALGKALGWETVSGSNMNHEWTQQWHSFIGHLIMGKDPELFFKDLLTK
jgi:hypothetical protein